MTDDLEKLDEKIKKSSQKKRPSFLKRKKKKQDGESSEPTGAEAGFELVGAILGSVLIGYFLDQWLDTKPFFILVMFLLGTATGFWNIYRLTTGAEHAVGFAHVKKDGAKTDNDQTKEHDSGNESG